MLAAQAPGLRGPLPLLLSTKELLRSIRLKGKIKLTYDYIVAVGRYLPTYLRYWLFF